MQVKWVTVRVRISEHKYSPSVLLFIILYIYNSTFSFQAVVLGWTFTLITISHYDKL